MIIPLVLMQRVLHSFAASNGIVSKNLIHEGELSSLFWGRLLISVLINLIFISCSPLIVAFYSEPLLYPLIFYFAFSSLLYSVTEVFLGILNRRKKFFMISIAELLALILSGVVAIIIAILGRPLEALIAKEIIAVSVTLMIVAFYSGWIPKFRFKIKEILYYIKFGTNVSIGTISSWLARSLDDILIGRKYSSEDLGIYNKAYSLLTLPTSLITNLALRFGIPMTAEMKTENEAEANYLLIARISFTLNAPIGLTLFFISDNLVSLLFGQEWMQMVPFIKLFSLLSILQVLGPLDSLIYQARNKTSQLVKSSLLINFLIVMSILVGFLLTESTFGIAIFYTIGSALTFLPSQYILARSMSTSLLVLIRNITHASIAVIISFTVCMFLQNYTIDVSPIWQLIITIIIVPVTYCLTLLFTSPKLSRDMLNEIKAFI
jgi:O-antigen/teichoic acid export membrane protein